MRLDSIRHRLLAIIIVVLASMFLLVINQIFNVNRLVEVQSHSDLLRDLNAQLLQLRRHEKDFLLRRDAQYVDEFERRSAEFSANLDTLQAIVTQYEIPAALISGVVQSFSLYTNQFALLVSLQQAIGLDENAGQQGRFRSNIHQLEEMLTANGFYEELVQLLQLRRHEKDFMLRRELSYEVAHQQVYQSLRGRLLQRQPPLNTTGVNLLEGYRSGFLELVESYQQMGLNQDAGLQGEFREAAHSIEASLADMDAVFTPLIVQRRENVRRSGLVIVVITAITLTGLLVRAFFNLQKAFNTLIMFFYRCKHQFELLDERKIYFAEFKALASVVNEMVQARRDAEFELKEARKKLEILEEPQSQAT